MAIQTRHTISAEQFDEFIFLPENIDHHFELIAGEIISMVSNNYSSEIAAEILFLIRLHMRETNQQGHVMMADGGYRIGTERYIPDVAFISAEKQPASSHEAYNPNPPDLVVEVISPTDSSGKMRIKVGNYLAAKVVVWVVRPNDKIVEVYVTNQAVQVLGVGNILDGGEVLPNFKIKVEDIFPQQYDTLDLE